MKDAPMVASSPDANANDECLEYEPPVPMLINSAETWAELKVRFCICRCVQNSKSKIQNDGHIHISLSLHYFWNVYPTFTSMILFSVYSQRKLLCFSLLCSLYSHIYLLCPLSLFFPLFFDMPGTSLRHVFHSGAPVLPLQAPVVHQTH